MTSDSQPEDLTGNRFQRGYEIDSAQLDRLVGHAEDHTRRLILCNIQSPGLLHFKHSPGTIVSHTGHDDTYSITAGISCSRAEKNIHGRTVTGNQRPLFDFHKVACSAP